MALHIAILMKNIEGSEVEIIQELNLFGTLYCLVKRKIVYDNESKYLVVKKRNLEIVVVSNEYCKTEEIEEIEEETYNQIYA